MTLCGRAFRFVQDKEQQGVLYNHDNDYLHYQDDWHIPSVSETRCEALRRWERALKEPT